MIAADHMRVQQTYHSMQVDNGGEKKCHQCGSTGHLIRNCLQKKPDNRDKSKQPRRRPNVKKFWCALHKGDKSRKCFSNSCVELRKMTDIQKRVELLNENGDCRHCLGDHKTTDCNKVDRVCGGGRPDRGCSNSHKINELFCKDAKVFMSNKTGNVVLCIMKVRTPKGHEASLFLDSGATDNFTTESFAKLNGWKGKSVTLSVTTLGGVVTEYLTVTEYTCFLVDKDGVMVTFTAYGLECITGAVSRIPSSKLQRLFPDLSKKRITSLERGRTVDVLIGYSHPSWHPHRKLLVVVISGFTKVASVNVLVVVTHRWKKELVAPKTCSLSTSTTPTSLKPSQPVV